MRKILSLLLFVMTSLVMPNTAWADDEVTVDDVSNSECLDRTRGESVMGRPMLKLTRFENGLYCEWNNVTVNCAYGDISVICQEEGQNLSINLHDDRTEGVATACLCHINVYFTIYNALKDEYQITLGGRNIGTVSFREHSVVEIDLETLEQAYEEGFDYPLQVEYVDSPDEFTDRIKPDWDLSQSLFICNYGDCRMHFVYQNYVLPCEYSYLDVEAGLDLDGTLVINILTDGIPGKNCKRIADLSFFLINVLKDSYHLRLNHTILYKGEDGQERRCTVCLYEDNITFPEFNGDITIPIIDNNDYEALITGLYSQKPTVIDINVPIFDLQGRRLNDKPNKGVYIQNGKKLVIK